MSVQNNGHESRTQMFKARVSNPLTPVTVTITTTVTIAITITITITEGRRRAHGLLLLLLRLLLLLLLPLLLPKGGAAPMGGGYAPPAMATGGLDTCRPPRPAQPVIDYEGFAFIRDLPL